MTMFFRQTTPAWQEVYEAVAGLGITEPVVPMWLPDGYELMESKITSETMKTEFGASFICADSWLILKIDKYNTEVWSEYHKDEDVVKEYERNGIVHYFMRNNDNYSVVWMHGQVECSLSAQCEEEIICKIVDSIYWLEGE